MVRAALTCRSCAHQRQTQRSPSSAASESLQAPQDHESHGFLTCPQRMRGLLISKCVCTGTIVGMMLIGLILPLSYRPQ